jgi:hypothetical protein
METSPDNLPAMPITGQSEQIMRRVEITVEREITTVIRRVRRGDSDSPADKGEKLKPE